MTLEGLHKDTVGVHWFLGKQLVNYKVALITQKELETGHQLAISRKLCHVKGFKMGQ